LTSNFVFKENATSSDHLPERDRPALKQRLRSAWHLDDHAAALERLRALAAELDRNHPGAAASLREGLEETLTLQRLGIRGSLKATLASTNPCESMIECVRRTSRNVKHWQSGEMALRWTAAGMLEAERQFRKVVGYRDLAKLAVAIERDLARATSKTRPRRRLSSSMPDRQTGTAVAKFHDERDILPTSANPSSLCTAKAGPPGAAAAALNTSNREENSSVSGGISWLPGRHSRRGLASHAAARR
jgi:hypothetical protein